MNNLTDEQQVPIDRWFAGSDSIAVRANPGTGKTFLLSHLLNDIPRTEKTMVVSFSNNGVDEIRSRCQNKDILFSTAHKIGAAINSNIFWDWKRGKRGKIYWDARNFDKYQYLIYKFLDNEGYKQNQKFSIATKLRPVVDIGRMYLATTEDELQDVCATYDMLYTQDTYYMYNEVIKLGKKRFFSNGGSSDHTDCIWMPFYLDADSPYPFRYKVVNESSRVNPFANVYKKDGRLANSVIQADKQGKLFLELYTIDNLVIDEAQDQSAAIINLLTMLAPSRVFMVGDPKQAIMSFAGAHYNSFELTKQNFEDSGLVFDQFSINQTFRFGKDIADYVTSRSYSFIDSSIDGVRQFDGLVNDTILPNPNVDSTVIHDKNWLRHVVPKSTIVLGRIVNGSNSVVIPALVQALQHGYSVKLQGINIVELCSTLLNYMKQEGYTKPQLDTALEYYIDDKVAEAAENEEYIDVVKMQDELSFVVSLLHYIDGDTAYELERNMKTAFGQYDADLTFSTVHRAKGMSYDCAVVLDSDKFPYFREGMNEASVMAEVYVWHVVISRAEKTLVLA